MVLPKDKGFLNIYLLLLILIIVVIGASWYFFGKMREPFNPDQPFNIKSIYSNSVPTPTPSPWKTYTDDKYGFVITYPTIGVVVNADSSSEGECGNAIMEDPKDPTNLLVDNFFTIKAVPFTGTVDDYMKSSRAFYYYDTTEIASASAAESALALNGLKKTVAIGSGFPPLAYTKGVYKKGDNIFLLKAVQFPYNFGGCAAPNMIDIAKYPDIANQGWDMAQSIKFK